MNDPISRRAAKDAFMKATGDGDKVEFCWGVLDSVPTIDPVKHGKWMPHPIDPDWDFCSVCGIGTHRRFHGYDSGGFWDSEESYQYCPWCGAKMEDEDDA